MNLFIGEHYLDTLGDKINFLQLVRQIAEDDEAVHGEVMVALRELLDYESVERVETEIEDGDLEDLALQDDTLFIKGDTLIQLFEEMFPGDYTTIVTALVSSLSAPGPTYRLDHNCLPVEQVDFDFSPVPEVQGELDVGCGLEMTTVVVEKSLGDLVISGVPVGTQEVNHTILFNVTELYSAIYGLSFDSSYLRCQLLEGRLILNPDHILIQGDKIMVSVQVLTYLHPRVGVMSEWYPLVTRVVSAYVDDPRLDHIFDALGNRVA